MIQLHSFTWISSFSQHHLFKRIITFYYFNGQIFLVLASGVLFKLDPVSFWHVSIIFEHICSLDHIKRFQAHLVLSSPGSGVSHFSQEASFLLVDNGTYNTKIWVLKVLISSIMLLTLGPLQWTELGYKYRHVYVMNPYIHMFVNPYTHLSFSLYIQILEFLTSTIPIQHTRAFIWAFPFLFVTPFSNSKKPDSY